jgi:hypothetical protein
MREGGSHGKIAKKKAGHNIRPFVFLFYRWPDRAQRGLTTAGFFF